MNRKCSVIYFLCISLLFSIIGSGCSVIENEAVCNSDQTSDKEALQIGTTSVPTQPGKEPSTQPTEVPVIESNSPWKLISDSKVETAVYYAGFLNESLGVTVGYSGATSYTEDGGENWSKSANVSACRYGLDLYSEDYIIDSGNSGVNLVSKDKGKTWSELGKFPLKGSYNKFLSILDTNNIYIGAKRNLGVSKDGGATWTVLDLPEGCNTGRNMITGMFFLTPEIGYLLSSDNTLYKTIDSCKSWTSQVIDLGGEKIASTNMPSVAINFQDEDHGMLVIALASYTLRCLKTENAGSSWESVEMPIVTCFNPYLSRDGKYLTLSSSSKQVCLYKLED